MQYFDCTYVFVEREILVKLKFISLDNDISSANAYEFIKLQQKNLVDFSFVFQVLSPGTVDCMGQSFSIGCTVQSKMDDYHIKFVHFCLDLIYTTTLSFTCAHVASSACLLFHFFHSFC